MILAIDIGNTNIVVGGYQDEGPAFVARISTNPAGTEVEYAVLLQNILRLYGMEIAKLEGAIISSVVPPLSPVMKKAVHLLKGVRTLLVGPGIKTGLNIKIDNPGTLGADLLATAVGAVEKYALPAIIVDLGTVSKITVVDREKSFRGGALMPGVMVSLKSLSSSTAQLPQINLDGEICHPIGTNTVDCMRSGVILGAASMVDGMVMRYQSIMGKESTVVACGGLVGAILPHCVSRMIRDDNLLLEGLIALYRKNR